MGESRRGEEGQTAGMERKVGMGEKYREQKKRGERRKCTGDRNTDDRCLEREQCEEDQDGG